MNRTRNKLASHARLGASGGLCAPVIPGVRLLRLKDGIRIEKKPSAYAEGSSLGVGFNSS